MVATGWRSDRTTRHPRTDAMPPEPSTTPATAYRTDSLVRRWWARLGFAVRWLLSKRWFRIYLALLVLSHLVIAIFDPTYPPLGVNTPEGVSRQTVLVERMDEDGPVGDEATYPVSVLRWSPRVPDDSMLPVLLLHGSPPAYAGLDFQALAPRLAATGRVV